MFFFLWMMIAGVEGVAPLRVNGLVAAVLSPFDSEMRLNVSAVTAQREFLRATGVDYVFVAGTTGESVSLTVAERKELLEAWVATDAKVIAHVGAEAMGDVVELAQHAEASGALAIGAMPPSYFKPATVEALALVLNATCAAAPTIPCYYYHIPSMTGVTFAMIDLVQTMVNVSNFAGVKYTGLTSSPGYKDAEQVLAFDGGRFEVFGGREEMMLESLAIGITGHVGSQFNLFGDLYNNLSQSFARDGLTATSAPNLRALQLTGISALAAQATAPTGVEPKKRFLRYAGLYLGDARLPYLPVTDDVDAQLRLAYSDFCADNADLYLCSSH